eukprot:GEMP01055299.1.p1 GENE.GEMP01055299.1~~GEMP01055299.1.p1  ORF type:complete len:154 (+),score=30.65 GEMP01055299.1:158-619(+)
MPCGMPVAKAVYCVDNACAYMDDDVVATGDSEVACSGTLRAWENYWGYIQTSAWEGGPVFLHISEVNYSNPHVNDVISFVLTDEMLPCGIPIAKAACLLKKPFLPGVDDGNATQGVNSATKPHGANRVVKLNFGKPAEFLNAVPRGKMLQADK